MGAKTRIAAMVATLAALALATALYAPSARHDGDLGLASGALEGLTFMEQAAGSAATSTDYSNALEDNFSAIDLFLHSDSRGRLPEVAGPVDDAWLGYLVADQLWRRREGGDEQPLVSAVYASDRLLRAFPELAAHVTGAGGEARFDDRGMKTTSALFGLARQRRLAAATAVKAEEER